MTVFQKRLSCTIILTLVFTLSYAVISQKTQSRLSQDIVRLRVIANSDTKRDQEIKLAVRDAVLAEISGWGSGPRSAQEMMNLLSEKREDLARTVGGILRRYDAEQRFLIQLDRDYYPTREYGTFSLPAGTYQGLKIYLGDGTGHNWWCVLYPSLCLDAASAEEALTEEETGLIHRENTEYAIRFRTVEILGELGNSFRK